MDTGYIDKIHQRKLHLEALIKKNDEECYLYVTFDLKRLKNFKNNPNYSIHGLIDPHIDIEIYDN
jgi:hypothetical protein